MTPTASLRPRQLPTSFVRYIRLEDEWPLFSIQLVPNEERTEAWAYLSHLPDLAKKPDGWMHLFHEWKRLERWCFHDGILGWYCVTNEQNLRFVRWLHALGAQPMGSIPDRGIQYQKKILTDPCASWSVLNLKDLAAFIRHGRVGHA